MEKKDTGLNIALSILLIFFWGAVLLVTFLLWLVSDVFRLLWNGALLYVFACLYGLAFILPVIFRKRLAKYLPLPASMLAFGLLSALLCICLLSGARSYISSFSRQKWKHYQRLRIYMIDDLEKKHQIIGKTGEEIVDLLGEPYRYETDNVVYEYYVGDSIIDPYGYRLTFENNTVKKAELIEH